MSITRVLEEKIWNFTFTPTTGGSWGWNSVHAKTKRSAVSRATQWVQEHFPNDQLDVKSVNCNPETYDSLMRSFW